MKSHLIACLLALALVACRDPAERAHLPATPAQSPNPSLGTEPTAVEFSTSTVSGVAPLTVRFRATSNGVSLPRWDFGDGTTDEGESVEHRYEHPGVYTAAMGVDTPAGPKVVIRTITVLTPLIADFSVSPPEGRAPLTVRFVDQSRGDVGNRAWDFGDGTTDTAPSPVHTYTEAGTFTVRLSVAGPAGVNDVTRTVKVLPADPSPRAASGGPDCDDTSAAARVRPSVVRIESARSGGLSIGTGIVVSPSGLLVTANHVVRFSSSATITLIDGRRAAAQVVARRVEEDLALLQAGVTGGTPIRWGNPQALRPGQRLLALGYAEDLQGEPSLTAGVFSAHRTNRGIKLIQTDAPVNHGNSGGPVFTQCGEVVGVVSFGLPEANGLNFAVSVDHVLALSGAATQTPPSPSGAAPSSGRWVRVAIEDCLNVREQPSTGRVLNCLPNGAIIQLLPGPMVVDGYRWWRIADGGWIADIGNLREASGPPPPSGRSATETVQYFYGFLFRGKWPEAYQLLSSRHQRAEPYPIWLSGFDQAEALTLERSQPGATPDMVTAFVVATDRATGAAHRRWITDWKLVQEAGEWRLDVGVRR